MKIAVRYYSRSGNTRKLAEAIAKAVNVEAKTTDEPLDEDVDIPGNFYYYNLMYMEEKSTARFGFA